MPKRNHEVDLQRSSDPSRVSRSGVKMRGSFFSEAELRATTRDWLESLKTLEHLFELNLRLWSWKTTATCSKLILICLVCSIDFVATCKQGFQCKNASFSLTGYASEFYNLRHLICSPWSTLGNVNTTFFPFPKPALIIMRCCMVMGSHHH